MRVVHLKLKTYSTLFNSPVDGPVCRKCMGVRVIINGAIISWDIKHQQWWHEDGGEAYCNDCQDNANYEFCSINQWCLFDYNLEDD